MSTEFDIDSLSHLTPEEIAQILFTQEPKNSFSHQIIAEKEIADVACIFEILMIILMEGLEIITGDLSKAKLENLTCNHLLALNPWFNSLGFEIKNVESFIVKTDESLYNNYYCKTIPRDTLHASFFQMKNINKNYHFFLNGPELIKPKTDLKDLHSIFVNQDTIFKIVFDFMVNNIVQ